MTTTSTSTTKAPSSTEDLSQQIEALREDLKKLASTIAHDMSEGVGKAGRQIGQTGRDARETATNAVLEHPLAAVGIAAGIGIVLGMMARKG
ncbi:MAG: DUF883 family protein [Roseovarius sp.]|jgi:ElaB/YqjD/DUF883 family membrane-anchored ribosome-binding protein|nr:DUF883 family protein [Roseovarius sp.]